MRGREPVFMGYRLVRALSRLLVSLFYRRVEAVGLERIPATGPLILAANHQNALVDPMLILARTPRAGVTRGAPARREALPVEPDLAERGKKLGGGRQR